jgi:hypothetical protein
MPSKKPVSEQVASGHVFTLISCSVYSSTLKMEAICSSETSVGSQRTTRRCIPEDGALHNNRYENLKFYIHTRQRDPLWFSRYLNISLRTPISGLLFICFLSPCSKLLQIPPLPHFYQPTVTFVLCPNLFIYLALSFLHPRFCIIDSHHSAHRSYKCFKHPHVYNAFLLFLLDFKVT